MKNVGRYLPKGSRLATVVSGLNTASRVIRAGKAAYNSKAGKAVMSNGKKLWNRARQLISKDRRVVKFTPRSVVTWKAKEGKFVGKFKSAKYKKYQELKKFSREGVIFKQESGSVLQANVKQSVYVGCSMGFDTTLQTVCMAIVKYLAKKCINYEIVNFHDTMRQSVTLYNPIAQYLYIFYKVQKTIDSQQIDSYDLQMTIDDTWYDLAYALRQNLRTNLPNAVGGLAKGEFRLISIGLTWFQSGAGTFNWHGTVNAEQIFLELKHHANLVIQNRTKDSDGSSSTDNVNSNPVVGKRYHKDNEWQNGFEPIRAKLASIASYDPLYANNQNGVIITTSTSFNPELMKKPPPGYMLGANKDTNVYLNPGDIQRGDVNFHINKIGVNTFLQKMFNGLQDPNFSIDHMRMPFGHAQLFGFETQLNDRTNHDANIAVSWELNHTYECRIFSKRSSSIPYVEIN